MELAVGHVSTTGVDLSAYKSYSLGTQDLIKGLTEAQGDFREFSANLDTKVASFKLSGLGKNLCPILLGSAATKVAWIKGRKSSADRYDPGTVHGRVITTESLDRLVSLAIQDPAAVRRVIDPGNPDSLEFETVMTGIVAISIFLKHLGKTEFKVSANGSRYGVVWMTAVYRKLGFDLPVDAANPSKINH
jgi:exopolyphosphatase/pppGpp-phosphohydrolase